MMKLDLYQVDAFADTLFSGNPAAVCPLPCWLPDAVLQNIASENNLSETAFFVRTEDAFELRWFTPACEVDLCGHATLATAHVLFTHLGIQKDYIKFTTRQAGILAVSRNGDLLTLDFPMRSPVPCPPPEKYIQALGGYPIADCYASREYVFVYEDENIVRTMRPDFMALKQLDKWICVTAPARDFDFVSRFFLPQIGINEDPVTGSIHCHLTPYWAQKLNKSRLNAYQASARGGKLACELNGDRVHISGHALTYMQGQIFIPA